MSNKEMKLIMEGWRGFINEEEKPNNVDNFVDQMMNTFDQLVSNNAEKITASAEKQKKQQPTNGTIEEMGVGTVIGLALALPAILELISKLAKSFKIVDKDPNKLDEASKYLHHKYKNFIKFILGKLPKLGFKEYPKEVQDKIADFILMAIVAAMAYYSGIEAYNAVKNLKVGTATFEGVLTAIKTGEVGIFATREIAAIVAGVSAGAATAAKG
jgi:hypothetical protein